MNLDNLHVNSVTTRVPLVKFCDNVSLSKSHCATSHMIIKAILKCFRREIFFFYRADNFRYKSKIIINSQ
jgi:hypothetical protein